MLCQIGRSSKILVAYGLWNTITELDLVEVDNSNKILYLEDIEDIGLYIYN